MSRVVAADPSVLSMAAMSSETGVERYKAAAIQYMAKDADQRAEYYCKQFALHGQLIRLLL